ncbi:MAG: tol-pal system YbgF family protein [Gammaproteobacteria bacterium]
MSYSVRIKSDQILSICLFVGVSVFYTAVLGQVNDDVLFGSSDNLITILKKSDPILADLLDAANRAMLDKNYSRAVQLFTKIRDASSGEVRRHVQELLGVAREYNGQLAHAIAEYQQYLEDYPEAEDAKRVKQRLTALITAPEIPKEKLRTGRRQSAEDGSEWERRSNFSFSQFYYRAETTVEQEETRLIRSDLISRLDFFGSARKGDLDFGTRITGSYRNDYRPEDTEGGEFLPDIMTVDGRHTGVGLYAQLGRQSGVRGGVLGRFDGINASYDMGSVVTLNTVYGYPVDITDRTMINTDQEFYGLNFDIGTLWGGWDFNAFYITQENAGISDREAVGGEALYFDTTKSLFTLVDYDIGYDDLNIFQLIGNWTVVDGTVFNLVVDYRNSPILTTTNAIQGQGVEELEELFGLSTEAELRQLARDRTVASQSVTAGITQQLNVNWQFIGEVTVAEYGETVASGGVEAVAGTGKEYFYSTQFIASSLFYDNDALILGLRYRDNSNTDTYTMDGNWRIDVNRKLRLNPRLRIDYREYTEGGDSRWLARPFIEVDYRVKKWIKFEMDLGYEWLDETFANSSENTTGYFLSVGYRAQF